MCQPIIIIWNLKTCFFFKFKKCRDNTIILKYDSFIVKGYESWWVAGYVKHIHLEVRPQRETANVNAISLVESVQPFRTDQFDSTCQSNQLTLIAMNFLKRACFVLVIYWLNRIVLEYLLWKFQVQLFILTFEVIKMTPKYNEVYENMLCAREVSHWTSKFNSGAGEQNDIRKFAKSGYETFDRFHLFCIHSGVNRL